MDSEPRGIIDLNAVWLAFNRRLIPILFSIVIVTVLTVVAYMMADPVYTATARVGLDRQSSDVLKVGVEKGGVVIDSSSVDTEVQVLRSPAMAEAVVKRLKLDSRPGFGQSVDGAAVAPAVAMRRAIDRVRNGLDVKRDGTSYVIAVGYSSGDPQVATDIVNATISAYVAGQRTAKVSERSEEVRQLSERMGKLRSEVISAETAVAQYRAATNLVDITKDRTSAQQALSALTTELAAAQADQAAADARAAASRTGTTTNLLQNPVVNQLVTRQAQLRAERNEMAGRYGDRHPSLAAIDSQLRDVSASIDSETRRVRTSIQSEADIARQRAGSVQRSIAKEQSELLAGNRASVKLAELERNAESSRQLYQAFLDRYRGALATLGSERSNSYIVAEALTPRMPTSPNLKAYMVGGIVIALISAVLVTLILEFLERGFRSRSEMEKGLAIRTIGSIPDLRTVKEVPLRPSGPMDAADYLLQHENSVFTESFRSIRTTLRLAQSGQRPRSLAITSSIANEGKTTAAICLARSAARSGLKVVLVDCDLRRRASSRSMATKISVGLADVLQGVAPLEKALVLDSASGAYLLPQREADGADYDAIASESMRNLIEQLKARFDLVILDTAPVLPVAESRAVCAMADKTLLVVRWRSTPAAAAALALRELELSDADVAGSILALVNIRGRAGMGNEAYYYTPYTAYTAAAAT